MSKRIESNGISKKKYSLRNWKRMPGKPAPLPESNTSHEIIYISDDDDSNKPGCSQQSPQKQLNMPLGHRIYDNLKENGQRPPDLSKNIQQSAGHDPHPDLQTNPRLAHNAFLDQWRFNWNRTLNEIKEVVLQPNGKPILSNNALQEKLNELPFSSIYHESPSCSKDSTFKESNKENCPNQVDPMWSYDYLNLKPPEKSEATKLEDILSSEAKENPENPVWNLDDQYVQVENKDQIPQEIWHKDNLCDHSVSQFKNPEDFANPEDFKAKMQQWQDIEAICMRLRGIEVPDNVGIVKGPVSLDDVFEVLGIEEEQPQPKEEEPIAGGSKECPNQGAASTDDMNPKEEEEQPEAYGNIFEYLGLGAVVPPSLVVLTGKEDALTDWTDSDDDDEATDRPMDGIVHTVAESEEEDVDVVDFIDVEEYIDVVNVDRTEAENLETENQKAENLETENLETENLADKEQTDEEEESVNDSGSDWSMENEDAGSDSESDGE
ncbi:uncharacterized protein [Drosophila takahashii]|uniref:uncharacterized protein n=1 Tax=Drosophila takahashii TaxID=29030 RepID=UPI003898DD17